MDRRKRHFGLLGRRDVLVAAKKIGRVPAPFDLPEPLPVWAIGFADSVPFALVERIHVNLARRERHGCAEEAVAPAEINGRLGRVVPEGDDLEMIGVGAQGKGRLGRRHPGDRAVAMLDDRTPALDLPEIPDRKGRRPDFDRLSRSALHHADCVVEIAVLAGFGSLRRFNAVFAAHHAEFFRCSIKKTRTDSRRY